MTEPGAPRRGRHSSADDGTGAYAAPRYGWEADLRTRSARRYDVTAGHAGRHAQPASPPSGSGRAAGAAHRSGLLDADTTGRLAGGSLADVPPTGGGVPYVAWARHAAEEPADGHLPDPEAPGSVEWPADGYVPEGRHPSAPLPPRPPGVWERLHRRADADDEAPTEARSLPPDGMPPPGAGRSDAADPAVDPAAAHTDEYVDARADEDATEAHPLDWQDATGGLEVVAGQPEERTRWGRRSRRTHAADTDDSHLHDDGDDHVDEDEVHEARGAHDDDLAPSGSGRAGRRRGRRSLGTALVLLLLVAVVAGVVVGGRTLLGVLNPTAEDYSGQGTGSVEVKVQEGDTLRDIATTLAEAGVIASVDPFVDAADANEAATGIQPGTYTLHQRMSGRAALDLLLDPESRLLSRVAVPEGLTVQATLQKIADETGVPMEDLQAAAGQPAALGVPAYAGEQLEGYLFPATYDFEPGTEPADMLREMTAQFGTVAAEIQLEQRAAAAGRTPAEIVTVASMIEAETRLDEERPDVAQVIYNRLERGTPLGIDATLAYGLGKNGNELTVDDLETDSPYNTRTRAGLPPTPISAPGRASLEAALAPSTGNLLYYVLESENGSHFFTDDYAEFMDARQRCADAGLGCGG